VIILEKLNKNSPVPLYFQLSEIIKEKIESNEWKKNSIIPSELKLCEDFQISRGTTRQAINYLIQEGYLYRRHGVGTFVGKKNYLTPVSSFYNCGSVENNRDAEIRRKIISDKIIFADEEIKECMNISTSKSKKVYKIETILLLNNRLPISFEEIYLLKDFFPNLKIKDLSNVAPYEIFVRKYKIQITKIKESFSLKKLDKETSIKLGIKKTGIHALLVNRFSWSEDNIFEYRKSIIRTDKCNYTVNLL
jgi:GntR family transcriptional regulator